MSADVNQECMSCFSVILHDYCKMRGRLFNEHRILSMNNNPFPEYLRIDYLISARENV